MSGHTPLLIIGAGPFGLGLARYARAHSMEHLLVGRPMDFWHNNMPAGMLLRSGVKWHLDPLGELDFRRYARDTAKDLAELHPLGMVAYLEYVRWFQERSQIEVVDQTVTELEVQTDDDAPGRFVATLGDGRVVTADHVVAAIGFHSFAHVPGELAAAIPVDFRAHTRDFVDFGEVAGQRIAIVGGRQSAFEWAALIQEAGAAAVHLIYRHDTPALAQSDWSWVDKMLDASEAEPGWWAHLPDGERERIGQAFWEEGRLKLEPWLAPRIDVPSVHLHPRNRVAASHTTGSSLCLKLINEHDAPTETAEVDHVVLATGYKVDIGRVAFLGPALRSELRVRDGSPELDARFSTSVPGLHFTSMPATRDFGPFMAFTVSVRACSRIVGAAIRDAIAP
jgi:cation diffusion facilitator CzcD-associated flavoprotein CzcO